MKKKKLKKKVDEMTRRLALLEDYVKEGHCHCENYKAKTVKFVRFLKLGESGNEELYNRLGEMEQAEENTMGTAGSGQTAEAGAEDGRAEVPAS